MQNARDRLDKILARLAARKADERVFLKIYAHEARAAAAASDTRQGAGRTLGPLDGAIVSIKDIFDVAGEPTLAGSVIHKHAAAATTDADVVARLRQAGAIILGKTNTTEFCFTSEGINPHYGTPGNARDPALIPGGSSSGAAVSVAEGTSEIAIGSDTGGSVRIPAALNGIVGFKPTASRISRRGVFPLSPTLDSVGSLARTVAACAAADAIMAGDAWQDFTPLPLAGMRIGLPPRVMLEDLDDDIGAGFSSTLDLLGRSGATLAACPIDDLLRDMREATSGASIASVEAAEIHADWLLRDDGPVDRRMAEPLKRRLGFPAWTYLRMIRARNELAAAIDARLRAFDAFVAPTLPIFAPPIDRVVSDPAFADLIEALLLRNAQIANQFDLTAISLPMPCRGGSAGLTLVARNGKDRRLLQLAAGIEKLLAA